MPTAYGAEFRQDVIDVARKGEAPLAQIAKDFGLSVMTLKRWIAIAERKDSGAGPAAAESAEMRELKKRNRLLERENEILRRAAAYPGTSTQNDSPAGHGSCRRGCPPGGDLQGVEVQQAIRQKRVCAQCAHLCRRTGSYSGRTGSDSGGFLEFPVFARVGMRFESHLGHVFPLFRGL